MSPQRIQMQRTKGWRKPEGAIYVGRPTRWGNPFTIRGAIANGFARGDEGDAALRRYVADCFRNWLVMGTASPWWYEAGGERHDRIEAEIRTLRGHDLACWCPLDQPCHADVLLELANR